MSIFGIFNQLLFTQNVNVARFARNVECETFSVIFKHRVALSLPIHANSHQVENRSRGADHINCHV